MAVVINEFQVAPQEGVQQPASSAAGTGASTAEPLSAEDFEQAIRRQLERYQRVRAH